MNQRKIQQHDQALHLGSLIGNKHSQGNVKKASNDLYFRTNLLMSNFAHCSVDVITSLFSSYCTSFYGSPLFKLSELDPLLLAWRKCIKKIYKLNIRTRSIYVAHLMPLDLINMLTIRFLNFVLFCVTSSNQIVNFVANLNVKDIVFQNLIFISEKYNVEIRAPCQIDKNYVKNLIAHVKEFNNAPYDHYVSALAIKDLCKYRDKIVEISSVDYNDVKFLFSFFTL